jgi:hypothetical protein
VVDRVDIYTEKRREREETSKRQANGGNGVKQKKTT